MPVKTYSMKHDGNVRLSANFTLKEMQSHDGADEGTAYPYYADYSDLSAAGTGTDSNRIKCINNTAQYWWMRTPHSGYVHYVRGVGAAGSVNDYRADYSNGVASACNII